MTEVEIITIGDELLIGQVVDTNSAWMAQALNAIGVKLKQITSVGDSASHIIEALNLAMHRADVIIMTGGLGPTKDDITKHTLCDFFNTSLAFDEKAYAIIDSIFKSRNKEISPINRQQAELPQACTPLYNQVGTASGMLFEKEQKLFFSLPGVPFEMKHLMEDQVLPYIKKTCSLQTIIHKTILTHGIGESFLAEKIADWESSLPDHIKLAYLPSAGAVRLRLSAYGSHATTLQQDLERLLAQVLPLIDEHVYGYDNDTLEEQLARELLATSSTIGTAESCTGGFIAHKITSVAGSSSYYQGSIVAYDNAIKMHLLNVKKETLDTYGAVSKECVEEMAKNALKILNTNYTIAISGIAGPGGGTNDKPPGTVWIAIANKDQVYSKKFLLGNNRQRFIEVASQTALFMLLKLLKQRF